MTDLETPSEFDDMLREENAVLFIFAEWSRPAMMRCLHVETWDRESFSLHAPKGTRIFRVHPHGFPHAHNWIYEQPKLQFHNAHGNLTCLSAVGTLVWLRSGVILDVERAFTTDMNELNRRTEMAFKQGEEELHSEQ
jgi:hypothetical protein